MFGSNVKGKEREVFELLWTKKVLQPTASSENFYENKISFCYSKAYTC